VLLTCNDETCGRSWPLLSKEHFSGKEY